MGAKRLGESLIEKKYITPRQLDQALKAQLIVGGHLGTCLIELGMIDEASLGLALSENFGVPHVPPEGLQEIPESTIALVPAKLAEEYKVVPFRVSQKVIHMAMVDPGNLPMLDALSFATDRRIVPWITPEVRIYQALEQYYGIPRRIRYISICRALDSAAAAAGRPPGAKSSAGAAHERHPRIEDLPETMGPDVALGGDERELTDVYSKSWHDVAAELHLDDAPSRASHEREGGARRTLTAGEPEMPPPPIDMTEVADRLCRAESKDDVLETMMAYATAHMTRCILFSVRKSTAAVWRASGVTVDPGKDVSFPLTSGVFDLLLGNDLYRGMIPREDRYEAFYRTLKIERPYEVLLIPIYWSDRLIAVFHGDAGPRKRVKGESDAYLRLFRLFGMTLNLLALKDGIRDAAHPPPEVRKSDKAPVLAGD